jgi:sortase A
MTRRLLAGGAVVALASGTALLGEEAWRAGKAHLAGRLVAAAFARHLADGGTHRPWAWADTHPIARLEVDRLGVRRHVLAGAHGPSLAFGPGHVDGTAPPNRSGHCVIAGHRDTWFAFLRHLRAGDEVRLLTREGARLWVVEDARIVPETDLAVLEPTAADRLTLVTCWPFGGPPGSPWRYAVACRPAPVAAAVDHDRWPSGDAERRPPPAAR